MNNKPNRIFTESFSTKARDQGSFYLSQITRNKCDWTKDQGTEFIKEVDKSVKELELSIKKIDEYYEKNGRYFNPELGY